MGKIYTFSEYQLDTRLNELRCAGNLLTLDPTVIAVLVYLIEHRHRVVSNQELIDGVWSGQSVGKAALVHSIAAARRAIGDRGRGEGWIRTLRNRGYRFVGPVDERVDVLRERRTTQFHEREL